MSILFKIFSISLLFGFLFYLLLPTPDFPLPPPDSVQSLEKADTETSLRRAYFTNFTRDEILDHYQKQFEYSVFFGIKMPTYRLNYPPEDAQWLIRDQTRSVFLEEIVHPFRESVFVNGFQARVAKDDIWYKGAHYDTKITIRYIPSSPIVGVPVLLLAVGIVLVVVRELSSSLKTFSVDWFESIHLRQNA